MDTAAAEAQMMSLANHYADAINRANFDDLVDCWAPDGIWRIPQPVEYAEFVGRDAIKERLAGRRAYVDIVVMLVGSVVAVSISDDRILGRTTIAEYGRIDAAQGLNVLGLYDDELIHLDGRWVYARRELNMLAFTDEASTYSRGTNRYAPPEPLGNH